MRTVVTKWAYIDYRCDLSSDYSGLFSEEVDAGWRIVSVSSCLDTFEGKRIIVLTAVLEKP